MHKESIFSVENNAETTLTLLNRAHCSYIFLFRSKAILYYILRDINQDRIHQKVIVLGIDPIPGIKESLKRLQMLIKQP